jgi:hypothetical protein
MKNVKYETTFISCSFARDQHMLRTIVELGTALLTPDHKAHI